MKYVIPIILLITSFFVPIWLAIPFIAIGGISGLIIGFIELEKIIMEVS